MYFAKRQGKGRLEVFSAVMRSDLLDRLQLGEDLRVAIGSEGLSVHYQPIVDMPTGAIVGAEALARWEHPTRGFIGPATFIPLAEEIGVVDRIDRWVLHQACTQGRAWLDAGMAPLLMSVNLSGRDLDSPDLVAAVAGILADTRFPASNLELELTEGVAIAESDSARVTLENLKALGLHLAIDDFGTGYSALARLRELPFDRLKVDKTFVDELSASVEGLTLVDSILDMARVLGLEVVAEGVETADQADFLRIRQCDFAQGYLFSRPVDAGTFGALLADGIALTHGSEPAAAIS
jgi:EAL domain-containing protein (putative c-di-GMP-specific phosphodiesterase class I)